MKIDLSPPMLDREPAFKTAPPDDDARRDQGRAFDAAIRDAKPLQKDAPKPGGEARSDSPAKAETAPAAKPAQTGKADAQAGDAKAAGDAKSAGDAKAKAAEAEDKADETAKEADGKQRGLQALLGLLTQTAAAATADQAADARQAAVVRTLVPEGEAKEGQSEAAEALSGGKAVRLDVLKMETHFEPHQDGMVLVRGEAEREAQARAAAKDGAELKASGKASDAASVLADLAGKAAEKTLADSSAASERLASMSAKAGTDAASKASDDAAALPLRFDEALARLSGREAAGGGGSDDGRGDRRGSDRSVAAELSVRSADANAKSGDVDGLAGIGAGGTVGLGLATQIADRMLEVLGEPAPRPSASASQDSQEHLRMRAGGAALKTLTIQLKPEHLGTLDVSMRLSEGRLTVELAASRADTAVLLSEDRGALRQLLERAGFSVDDASITVVAKDMQPNAVRGSESSASASGGDSSGSGSASGQTARDGASAREGEERGGRKPPEQASVPVRRDDAPARGRSSTYL